MKKPEFHERFLNKEDVVLPLGIDHDDVRAAIERVYRRYHKVNEFHIDGFGIRFHDSFRAMNSLGDYLGHQFNDALIDQRSFLEHNPHDDRRPDIIHERNRAEAKVRDGNLVDGIEQKAAQHPNFLTSHNESHTNLLFIQYRVNEPGKIRDELEPIEFTQILCADASKQSWEFEPRGQNSNTTYRAADDLKDALRSNPLYQHPDAICQNEHVHKYRKLQASFDPVYDEQNPHLRPNEDGSNVCDDCGGTFKNARGVASHQGSSDDCGT